MALPVTITGITEGTTTATKPFLSSGGNVYVFGKSSTTGSNLRAFKATDPTSSFSNVGTDFAVTSGNGLSCLKGFQVGDVIHIVTFDLATTAAVDLRYHTFDMSTDAWVITNETIKNDMDIVTGTANCTLVVRSDGDVIVLYNAQKGAVMGSDYARVKYARREGGTWTLDVAVDNGGTLSWLATDAILGGSDRAHLFIVDQNPGNAYQRALTSGNSLQAFPAAFDTNSNNYIVQGVSYDSSGTQKVRHPYNTGGSNDNSSAKFDSADTPSITEDNDITGATGTANSLGKLSFAADGTTLWHTFVGSADSDIYTQSNANDGGWDTPTEFYDDGTAVSAVHTNIYTRGGSVVLGIVYYAGGSVKYHEKTLTAGTTDATFDMDATASVTWQGRSTAASRFNHVPAASLTWQGRSTASSRFNQTATASLTWNGTGLYPAAFDSDAAASLTWNGRSFAASALSSVAAASLTWNGASSATAAFASDALASLTWNGAAIAATAFDSDAAASLTWNGAAFASVALNAAAVASVTWNGAEIQAASAADWSSEATASLTWNGASVFSTAWDSDAAATLTWNGRSTAAAAFDQDAAASLTWNGTGLYSAAFDSDAAATLTWNGTVVATAAFDSDAVASVTWNGTGLYPGALSSVAAASVTWNGRSTASAALDSDAVVNLTWNGTSTASAALDSDALATLTWAGTMVFNSAWSSTATSSVTWNGAAVATINAAFSMAATASVTWNGRSTASAALDSDALATLTWNGRSTAASAYDSDAAATLTWNGAATTAGAYNSRTAAALLLWVSRVTASAAFASSAAAATLTWTGEEVSGAFAEGSAEFVATSNVAFTGASTAAASFYRDAAFAAAFFSSGEPGRDSINLDGWKVKARQRRAFEEVEEEDIIVLTTALYNFVGMGQ